MADPLSMSASIAGLISVADIVFRAVFKYARAVKDAKNNIANIAEEINSLSSVLRSLHALTLELEAGGDNFDPTLRNHYLSHCRNTIEKIEKRVGKVSKTSSRSRVSSVIQQLKWPFSTSETKELLVELSRHKQTINIALSADSMRKLQICLSKMDELSKQASSIEAVANKIEINAQIIVDRKKQDVLDYFMKTSPQGNLRKSISDRHPMTGLWLTESHTFNNWLETPGSRIWLSGIPGAGKTVLAGSVIQEALTRSHVACRVGVGFFFCDYKNSMTCEPSNVLGALASQLARQKDEAFNILRHYYDELHPERGLSEEANSDELRAKICSMSELFDQTIIVVDGLDECGDATDSIVQILTELAEYGTCITMALFSRDHDNIRFRLEADFTHIPIVAQKGDIRVYVGAEMEKRIQSKDLQLTDVSMKEEIMDTLVERAKGMFRWVVCQIDYLCDCAHDEERREALTKLPPNLPESYRRLLERVNRFSPKVQAMVQMCLHFIAFAEPKLTVTQLQQAVSAPDIIGAYLDASNTIPECEISRRCSSLIRKSECGRYFEFAHFSVQEFLEDESALSATPNSPSLASYLISQSRSHNLLAAQCLKFLQLKNFNQSDIQYTSHHGIYRKYPFYLYSTTKWLQLTKAGLDPVTLSLTKSLFHPSKTKYFWLCATEIISWVFHVDHTHAIRVVSDDSFRPLHLACALNLSEVCDFLLEGDADVNFRSCVGRPIDLAITLTVGVSSPNLVGILPCTQRRNHTIDCLIKKGAKLSNNIPSFGGLSIFCVACELATTHFGSDFTPIIALLSLGVVPTEREIREFRRQIYVFRNCNELESSTRKLIQYLSSTSSYGTNWGFQLGSTIWEWALAQNLAYTDDPFIIDTRISITEKALITKIKAATTLDNVSMLKNCLHDDRLNVSELRLDGGGTILHLAVEDGSIGAIGALLDAGCDSSLRNSQGLTPLHLCLHGNYRTLIKQFLERGVSLLSLDATGRTILHLWAEGVGDGDFLAYVFELDPKATFTALLMKTSGGSTPLALSLNDPPLSRKKGGDIENRAIEIIKLSKMIPDFWQNHDPMFGAAVKRGYEEAIRCLRDANAKLDPVLPGTCTPLHQIRADVSLQCVKLLQSLCGDAYRQRFGGRLPVEIYIQKSLRINPIWPDLTVIGALLSSDMVQDDNDENKTPWDFVQDLQAQELQNLITNIKHHKDTLMSINDILAVYMQVGLHKSYEDQHNESVIISLLSAFLNHKSEARCLQASISEDTLHRWISSTRLWPSARKSRVVLQYLKVVIRSSNLAAVSILVDNDVDIYQCIGSVSVMKYACQSFVTGSGSSEAILLKLLDKSNKEQLVDIVLDEALHKLATSSNKARFFWLMRHFIKKGVNIHSHPRGCGASEALMYHVNLKGGCAELLLDIGADPSIAASTHGSINAIQLATMTGDIGFLKSVLKNATAGRLIVDWAQTFNFSVKAGRQLINLQGINALHLASLKGRIKCLQFYINETTRGPEVNAAASVGEYTPLHLAANYNHTDAIDFLLSKGAKLMHEDSNRRTPLHWAVMKGNVPAIRLLLERGSWETFDNFGKKPRALIPGSSPDRDNIIKCLDEVSNRGEMDELQMLAPRRIYALSKALEKAILGDDLRECKSALAFGCPVNVQMPSCHGCSPLILAMRTLKARSMSVEWLLEHGASVLTSACQLHGLSSPIEIAAKSSRLNSLLPKLIDTYFSQGGDLLSGDDYPLHGAICWQNNKGLKLLLQCIERWVGSIGRKHQISPQEVMSRISNRRAYGSIGCNITGWSKTHATDVTALHIASTQGDMNAASILIGKGASVDMVDGNGWTPLVYAKSSDMAKHLISLGASTAAVYGRFPVSSLTSLWGQEKSSQLFPLYFGNTWQFPTPKKSLLSQMSNSAFPMVWEDSVITREHILLLTELGHDLASEHEDGRSWMHRIMCQDHSSDFILKSDFEISRMTPFPWHLEWCLFGSIAFLRSRFSEFQQKLPREVFQRIMNLEPKRGWSPLCRAACLDLVDVMENCLSMGAQVDFEGCPAGSALMIAGICGSFNAVKLLVHHHQAAICYEGKDGPMSVLSLTESKSIIEWLLVKRFTESLRIESGSQHLHSDQVPKERPWSGIAQAKLRLVGKWEMQPHESSLDYAKRLAELRKRWKGKVVPIYDSV